MHSVDFLRGLALTIVLLDHIDLWAGSAGYFRDWTLMGLGFSDAAEAFIFLSGFTFGRVYGPRMERHGFYWCQKKVLARAVQVYCAYLAMVGLVMSLGFLWRDGSASLYPAVGVDDTRMLSQTLFSALHLSCQPFGLGILCLYVAVLPFLPCMLALCRRSLWLPLGLSTGAYVAVQCFPALNLPAQGGDVWYFNPFAWQFLLVFGVVFGQHSCEWRSRMPRILSLLALALLCYGLLVRKGGPFLVEHTGGYAVWGYFDVWRPPLISKSNLGPLRLLHFLAVAHLVSLAISEKNRFLQHCLARPFIVCGRHSLPIYCVGTLLAYLSIIAFRWLGASWFTVTLIAVDACLIQFLVADLLDYRYRRGDRLERSTACPSRLREPSSGIEQQGPADGYTGRPAQGHGDNGGS